MAEEWREIPGTDYSVSSEGRVASRKNGGWKVLRPLTGGAQYYSHVCIYVNGGSVQRTIHTLVAEAFLGPKPTPRHEVNHKNGDRRDPRVENLEWATRSENIRHKFNVLGRVGPRGERQGRSILTEVDVREIRAYCATGKTQAQVASDYGTSQATISDIVTGRSWGWLDSNSRLGKGDG